MRRCLGHASFRRLLYGLLEKHLSLLSILLATALVSAVLLQQLALHL